LPVIRDEKNAAHVALRHFVQAKIQAREQIFVKIAGLRVMPREIRRPAQLSERTMLCRHPS